MKLIIALLAVAISLMSPSVASADQEFGGCSYGQEILVAGSAGSSVRIVYHMVASYDEPYSIESVITHPGVFDEYVFSSEVRNVQSWERVSAISVFAYPEVWYRDIPIVVGCHDIDFDSEFYGPGYQS